MAEETKPGEAEPKNDVQQEPKKEHDDTVTIRKGEYSGLKTQLKQMQKQLEEYSAKQSAEEAAKLKAASDWEALEKKSRSELEAARNELASTRRAVLSEKAKSALLEAGMRAGLTANGALSMLPQDIEPDGIAAWVADIRKQYPEEFKVPASPIGAPSAGPTGKPTTDQAAALRAEWEAARPKGPDAMRAVARKIDAYIASGKPNPLAP